LNFQCLSKRHLHMNYKWSEGQKCLNAWRAWTLTLLHLGHKPRGPRIGLLSQN
jgi:hypothetical protein